MARPKKPITLYKEALVNLSYKERLKEYLRLFYADDDPLAKEKVALVKETFSPTERKDFYNYYLSIFNVLIKEKNMYKLLSLIVEYYALYINDIIKEIDNSNHTILLINSILSMVKKEANKESSGQEEDSNPYRQIENLIKNYENLDGGITIDHSRYYLNIDYSNYKGYLFGAISNLKKHLSTAKAYNIALSEYAKHYKIEDLIPKELYSLCENVKRDLSNVWWNSSRVYKKYTEKENKDKEDEDIINTIKNSIIYPTLFPDYEDVEPDSNFIGKNNILIEQCAISR